MYLIIYGRFISNNKSIKKNLYLFVNFLKINLGMFTVLIGVETKNLDLEILLEDALHLLDKHLIALLEDYNNF